MKIQQVQIQTLLLKRPAQKRYNKAKKEYYARQKRLSELKKTDAYRLDLFIEQFLNDNGYA